MTFTQYLPHVVYSTALTSLAMHSLFHRKEAEEERSHVAAQISILDSMAQRLRSGEDIPDKEFAQLWKLAKSHDVAPENENKEAGKGEIGWKDMFLGKKNLDSKGSSDWDAKDLDKSGSIALSLVIENKHSRFPQFGKK